MTSGVRGSLAGAVALSLLVTGCFTTTVRSGLPAGKTPVGFHDRWHSAFLLGSVSATPPYDLAKICPRGWSEFRTETSFLQGSLLVLSLFIYAPERVTVVCAARPGDPPLDEPGAGPLPPLESEVWQAAEAAALAGDGGVPSPAPAR